MTLGQKFAVMQQFDGRLVDTFGLEFVLREAMRGFTKSAERDPQVIVPFHHTVKQLHRYDMMHDADLVRTEAYVIRAQLAIEGPR
ncbi:hypothetical protein [Mycolicibacterium aichiense]|uniref:Uncharacterized protein n=1 Tax=Mycolicibacterium aichiense TaxID=1799 RepID=A0A378VDS1_9MYCO|nr:hypothetical protein [Mycolicibacterium aichiense]QFG08008.1 hypothetical protein SEA_HERBERTWM_39 [Mycobacterium phage Herbertwm]MCV7016782.1 hypothetical protein [Mycolicibacterium aichiense]SUA14000.1 Uncharacterised protein [Mycolicibacterium aichiense]SUA14422.1 Uncharacterised protein [Mycolicibacterium aichiense]BBX09435.1 hypothetical protein MAIC_42380 [Mycolicibacterium aichiense]